jgi:DNA-binding response OmpR family regulator
MIFKILVVDDDELTRTTYKGLLELYDFEVYEARNGEECLKLCNEIKPDIILLDLIMPGTTGFHILPALNKMRHDGDLDCYIIVSSVSTSFKDISKAIKLGADDFFFKHHEMELIKYRIIVCITKLLLSRNLLKDDTVVGS